MTNALIILNSAAERDLARKLITESPTCTAVEFKGVRRTPDQNAKMWVMLSEISERIEWPDDQGELRLWTADQWKNFFVVHLCTALNEPLMLMRTDDGARSIDVGRSSSRLLKREFAMLLELISEFAHRHGCVFRNEQGEESM